MIDVSSYIKPAYRRLNTLVFPPRCPGCDDLLYAKDRPRGFCPTCAKDLRPVGQSYCMVCGLQLRRESDELCSQCRGKSHAFTQHRGVFIYKPPMKAAMYRFKYANRRCYGRTFARAAARYTGDWISHLGVDAIIPVPMYHKKEKRRGYNQAAVFARALSEETGIPVLERHVARIKDSAPQKTLNVQERKNNLKNAFKVADTELKLNRVLLVDDIYTTGATMDQVSEALLASGISEVYGLSVCVGVDRPRR